MNNPMLLIERLEDLLQLAREAETGFEKAAVFAATKEIYRMFDERADDFDSYALEKLHDVTWHINAIIGYDVTNNHSKDQHISWAIGYLSTFKSVIKERFEA